MNQTDLFFTVLVLYYHSYSFLFHFVIIYYRSNKRNAKWEYRETDADELRSKYERKKNMHKQNPRLFILFDSMKEQS